MTLPTHRIHWSAVLIVISIILLIIYYPGLFGDFILDDYGNLDKLGDYNGIRNLATFLQYINSGIAGPSGRPISLLSFLIDGQNWPADPFPFKRTNLIIHGLNGLLLFFCARLLVRRSTVSEQGASIIALFASALWVLHPFHVSTVLYVVQRMAMLSAFFSLATILAYLYARQHLGSQPKKAYGLMTFALGTGTLLSTLSKENGALTPLLILCLEVTVLSAHTGRNNRLNRYWSAIFLGLPSLFILAYLLKHVDIARFDDILGHREFSLKQRLLTECRIVMGYLHSLLIPRMSYPGVLNEQIVLSKGVLEPLSTLPAFLAVLMLPAAAWLYRKKQPFIALALLFFFAGHILESTTIALELYFEHRNYLPSVFLFLPAAVFFEQTRVKLLRSFIVLFLLMCCFLTYQRAALWGDPVKLSLFWAHQNTDSARAQRTAAMTLEQKGYPLQALKLLKHAKKQIPQSLDIQLHWAELKCQYADLSEADYSSIQSALRELHYTSSVYNLLEVFFVLVNDKPCKAFSAERSIELLDILQNNPSVLAQPDVIYQMHHVKGLVYAKNGFLSEAYREFDQALKRSQRSEHGLLQAGILATHGAFESALTHLDTTQKIFAKKPDQHHYFATQYDKEIRLMRAQIEMDFEHAKGR